MARSRAINHISPWKPADREPPWVGFENILFGPLGHQEGFEEYENGQDPGVVWTVSEEQDEGDASVVLAKSPTKNICPRPRMRPPPPASEVPAPAPEPDDDSSPMRKRRRTELSSTTPALPTPGASSAIALAKSPSVPRTPATSPGAPRRLVSVVLPTSASKRPSLVGPAPRRSKARTDEGEDELDE